MAQQNWRQILPIYLLFVIAFPLAMLWVEARPLHGPTICFLRQATHLDCPGCGMTRAFRAMGRLDVASAFRYNPLGPALFVTVTWCWLIALAQVITGGRIPSPRWWLRWRFWMLYAGIAIYLLVGVGRLIWEVRNPPPSPSALSLHLGWPFSLLDKGFHHDR